MSIKAFLLLLVIALLGTFIYLKVQVLGPQTSSFNQTTRFKLGRYYFFRSIFNLSLDGDGRYAYVKGNTPIILEIVQATDISFTADAIQQFTSLITKYTGRQVVVINNDTFQTGKLTKEEIKNIVSIKRRNARQGDTELFIMYADDYDHPEGEIAETYKDYGIILSHQRLTEVTSDYQTSLPQYEASTLLHEFGHQIGLEHNEGNNCVMNASVDQPNYSGDRSGQFTATDFCQTEIDQINAIKALVQ